MSPEDYGVYSYVQSILSALLLFNGFGVLVGMLQLCSEEIQGSLKSIGIFKYSTKIGVAADVIMALGLLIAAFVITLPLEGASSLLRLISFLPLAVFIFEVIQVWYRSQSANREYSLNMTINSILLALGTLGGALIFAAEGAFLGYYLAYIISTCVAFFGIRKVVKVKAPVPAPEEKKILVKISITAALNNAVSSLVYLIDVLLIGSLLVSSIAVAEYKVATLIPTALAFIPSTIMVYMVPYFARHRLDKTWCYQKYKTTTVLVLCITVFLVVILILCAEPLITILFGTEYVTVVPVFRLLLIGFFFNGGLRTVAGNILGSQRKYTLNLIVSILMVVVDVVFCVLLIPRYGIMGAAFGNIAAMGLAAIIMNTALIRLLKPKKDKA